MFDKFIEKIKSSALGALSGDACEIKVAMLGPRRAGKTSMLTAMYERFEQSLFQESIDRELKIIPDDYTMEVLLKNYKELESVIMKGGNISSAILGDSEEHEYSFSIKNRVQADNGKTLAKIIFKDYPGGWLTSDKNSSDYQKVISFLREAHIVLIAVDTPYLMEEDGQYNELRNIPDHILTTLKTAWGDMADVPHAVILVPIKSEKYLQNKEEGLRLEKTTKEKYSQLIDYFSTLEKCLVVYSPIQTTGCITFSHFIKDGENTLPSPVFSLPDNPELRKYMPRNCAQPLRYCLLFTISYFKNQHLDNWRGKIASFLRLDKNFVDAAEKLAAGCSAKIIQPFNR